MEMAGIMGRIKSYKGKSMRPGGGGRFAKGVDEMMSEKGMSHDRAAAIMAAAGRKKYGGEQMAKWSAAGRAR